MKKINRFYTLMLILLVLVSMLVTPVAAASDSWQNRFRQFPLLSSGSSRSGYVKALQTFLYYYSYETKQLISDGGGIDGSYGSKTLSAVKNFKEMSFLTILLSTTALLVQIHGERLRE